MTKHFICALFCCMALLGSAQQSNEDPVLLKINDKEVTKAEFEIIFRKNNNDSAITKADLDEYVELFINFKLKVAEAEEKGMDTIPSFVRELKGYREQLAAPYLVDKATSDSLIRQAYDRMQVEVKASHILIKLPPDPSPEDTLKAYRKISKIKKQVEESPETFGEVAEKQSEDPSAANNKGDLGYFTGLQMVYPFENAVYQTKVGEIGGPVRTKFGYHLVKVENRREARGQIKAAHIMIRSEESDPEDVRESSKQRADEVYEKLESGESFEELAKKYSDDRSSANKGGELPAFGTGRMVPEFEEAAYGIRNPGEVVGPVKSMYGWHIIKLIERVESKSFEEMKKELETKIKRDSRSNLSKESFIQARKDEYNFSEKRNHLKAFYKAIDSTYFDGTWEPDEKLKNSEKELFTLDGNEYTQADYLNYITERMRGKRKRMEPTSFINSSYNDFVDKTIMEYEDSRLEEKYPEFRALMNEYRDGILLFDLTDTKVWSKAVEDSTGLANFYEKNKSDFMWKERAEYEVYTVENASIGKKVIKLLKKGKNQDEIRGKLGDKSALALKVENGVNERSAVPVLEKVDWKKGVSDVINDDGQFKVVRISKIIEPTPKGLEEARGLITAAYQSQLEDEWIEELRKAHEITVNKEVLYSIK
ncbi:MAG: peptidylprolyl isomerase [Flavobacteriales bacterium]|nr:peptidylprolyl isomerase [Flavobacteriales bacterium]